MPARSVFDPLAAGPSFTADEEFDHLCFEYGIELDDVVGEMEGATVLRRFMQPQVHPG